MSYLGILWFIFFVTLVSYLVASVLFAKIIHQLIVRACSKFRIKTHPHDMYNTGFDILDDHRYGLFDFEHPFWALIDTIINKLQVNLIFTMMEDCELYREHMSLLDSANIKYSEPYQKEEIYERQILVKISLFSIIKDVRTILKCFQVLTKEEFIIKDILE